MQTAKLGDTSLTITPIGLGLAALGRPGYINLGHAEDMRDDTSVAAMQARAHRMLDAAYDHGIRYFDAARSYGRAEDFLGSWLQARGIKPDEVTVGSKWGYTYTAGWQVQVEVHEVKEHSLVVLQRQRKETQANLGAHLDLYQIHSATLQSGVLENQAVLNELARMKAEGLAIGLTVSGPKQAEVIERAVAIKIDGVRLFDTVQATWNLLERSAGPSLRQAHAAGMGVIVKEALANGRLTPRAAGAEVETWLKPLYAEAERLKTSLDALALAAVLAQPWTGVALSGAARPEHLESNLQALNVTWDEQAQANLTALTEPPEVYWQKRSDLSWN